MKKINFLSTLSLEEKLQLQTFNRVAVSVCTLAIVSACAVHIYLWQRIEKSKTHCSMIDKKNGATLAKYNQYQLQCKEIARMKADMQEGQPAHPLQFFSQFKKNKNIIIDQISVSQTHAQLHLCAPLKQVEKTLQKKEVDLNFINPRITSLTEKNKEQQVTLRFDRVAGAKSIKT